MFRKEFADKKWGNVVQLEIIPNIIKYIWH